MEKRKREKPRFGETIMTETIKKNKISAEINKDDIFEEANLNLKRKRSHLEKEVFSNDFMGAKNDDDMNDPKICKKKKIDESKTDQNLNSIELGKKFVINDDLDDIFDSIENYGKLKKVDTLVDNYEDEEISQRNEKLHEVNNEKHEKTSKDEILLIQEKLAVFDIQSNQNPELAKISDAPSVQEHKNQSKERKNYLDNKIKNDFGVNDNFENQRNSFSRELKSSKSFSKDSKEHHASNEYDMLTEKIILKKNSNGDSKKSSSKNDRKSRNEDVSYDIDPLFLDTFIKNVREKNNSRATSLKKSLPDNQSKENEILRQNKIFFIDQKYEINDDHLFLKNDEVNIRACPLFNLNYGTFKLNKPKAIKKIVYRNKEICDEKNMVFLVEWEDCEGTKIKDTFHSKKEILANCPALLCHFFMNHKIFEKKFLSNTNGNTKVFSIGSREKITSFHKK